MGFPVDRTKIIAYTLNGVLAGLAGALLAARLAASQPIAGAGWEIDAISAVVVGGTLLTGGAGSISGSLAGVLLLSCLAGPHQPSGYSRLVHSAARQRLYS